MFSEYFDIYFFCIIIPVLSTFIYLVFLIKERVNNEKRGKNQNYNTRKIKYTCTPNHYDEEEHEEQQVRQSRSAREIKWKILMFWQQAHQYVIKYIEKKDLDSLIEFIYNVWSTRDKEASAIDLHNFIESSVERLYPFRAEKEYLKFIMELCELDISNYSNYIKLCKRSTRVFIIPTKYCILLEKNGDIEKAIELCDYFSALKIQDYGYESFEKRKQHLLRKATLHSK